MKPVLNHQELNVAVSALHGWKLENNHLVKHFSFADFSEAFAFMSRVALLSEQLNHHAHWLAVYNKVSLSLQTHESGGITEKDIQFAEKVDAFAD